MGHGEVRNSVICEFLSYWWSRDSRDYLHRFVFDLNFSADLIFKIIDINVRRKEVSNSVRGKFLPIDEAGVRDFMLFIF
jgi:hypothetical protein